jgi:hypothetical protein
MAPPTSWDSVAFPDARPDARPDAPAGVDGGTPLAQLGANDPDDRYADSGSGIDTSTARSMSAGSSSGVDATVDDGSVDDGTVDDVAGSTVDDGAEVWPPPVADTGEDTTGIVDGLVGTLTDVAKPVTSLLVSVVDSVTGGRLGN